MLITGGHGANKACRGREEPCKLGESVDTRKVMAVVRKTSAQSGAQTAATILGAPQAKAGGAGSTPEFQQKSPLQQAER